jgi:hypothetical protein
MPEQDKKNPQYDKQQKPGQVRSLAPSRISQDIKVMMTPLRNPNPTTRRMTKDSESAPETC